MAVTQYIGARYVPLFATPLEWDNTKTYEPLTIVIHNGNSYTSRQSVPTGIDIANEDYWALTGNYNSQIEQYRSEVKGISKEVSDTKDTLEKEMADTKDYATTTVDNLKTTVDYNSGQITHANEEIKTLYSSDTQLNSRITRNYRFIEGWRLYDKQTLTNSNKTATLTADLNVFDIIFINFFVDGVTKYYSTHCLYNPYKTLTTLASNTVALTSTEYVNDTNIIDYASAWTYDKTNITLTAKYNVGILKGSIKDDGSTTGINDNYKNKMYINEIVGYKWNTRGLIYPSTIPDDWWNPTS